MEVCGWGCVGGGAWVGVREWIWMWMCVGA